MCFAKNLSDYAGACESAILSKKTKFSLENVSSLAFACLLEGSIWNTISLSRFLGVRVLSVRVSDEPVIFVQTWLLALVFLAVACSFCRYMYIGYRLGC